MSTSAAARASEPGRPEYRVQLLRCIDEVSPTGWDAVASQQSLFLSRRYLRCLETEAGPEAPQHRYALITDADAPVGIACFQITEFVGQPSDGWLARETPVGNLLARKLGLAERALAVPVVVCGSACTTGEHGYAFTPEADPARAAHALAAAVRQIEQEQAALGGHSAVLFKEFYPSTTSRADRLVEHSFHAIETAPNMVLPIDPQWGSFEGYLESLSSKYRVKAKRAYAKSAALVVKDLCLEDVHRHQQRMSELYDAVLDRAEFRLGRVDPQVLPALRAALGDELVLKGTFLGDRLVGFMSGFFDGDALEAHLVGVDYELNREHGIYSRMLYDYLRVALSRGASRVNYGRTADQIKSSVGAVPVTMTCYVRHRERTLNRLLPTLARYVRLPSAPLREPFKKAWYAVHRSSNAARLGLPSGATA